jgi:hypothetical protein
MATLVEIESGWNKATTLFDQREITGRNWNGCYLFLEVEASLHFDIYFKSLKQKGSILLKVLYIFLKIVTEKEVLYEYTEIKQEHFIRNYVEMDKCEVFLS